MAEPKTEEFLDEIEKAEIEELGDELIDIDEEAAELDEIEALKVERDDFRDRFMRALAFACGGIRGGMRRVLLICCSALCSASGLSGGAYDAR